jgi:hypothetical protein
MALACHAQFARRIKEYNFTVSGGVLNAEDDTPVQEVEVTLEVNGPVYDGVTLVKTVHSKTANSGNFVFAYLSHRPGVKYSLTVRKAGFEAVTVSGSSPPEAKHVIRLKRTESSASRPQN